MWAIDNITIQKTSLRAGEASVKFDDEGSTLSINKIQVDLNDGANPVQILKSQGTPVVSGTVIDDIKDIILELFQGPLSDEPTGIFKCADGDIERL